MLDRGGGKERDIEIDINSTAHTFRSYMLDRGGRKERDIEIDIMWLDRGGGKERDI